MNRSGAVSDVRERVARHQRERRARAWVEHPQIVRVDDLRALDHVGERALDGDQPDDVARIDLAEPAEERVAVAGQPHVAAAPGRAVPAMWPTASCSVRASSPSRTIVETPSVGISRRPSTRRATGASPSPGLARPRSTSSSWRDS
jgi:hypothetical protein